jgi:multidrug resistance efflux pump
MIEQRRLGTDPKLKAHGRIIKVTTYSVASVLAILMVTASLPPIVADESDRAILDAPITLLTSPIAGEVASLDAKVGIGAAAGTPMAEIKNTRVDQTTLMTLQSKVADYRQALTAAQSKKAADQHYVDALDTEIAAQKKQLILQFEQQQAALQGKVASASAMVEEKRALRDRQVNMVARSVASSYMLKPTTQELSGAQGMHDSASATLAANLGQLDAIKHDVFVGDNLVGIATLAQKRRDIAFDLERQKIDEAQAQSGLVSETALFDSEDTRLKSMLRTRLVAPHDGEVLSVGAAVGRHVSPGDSLATLVDCQNLFAVAIFSYRQAQNLSVGTHVMISSADLDRAVPGTVATILPKSSDKTDDLYAVAFPQTERREMYVIVKPDADNALRPRGEDGRGTGACPVGQWVTVSRKEGWVPSSSVVWHQASALFGGLFSTHDAEAHQRDHRKI